MENLYLLLMLSKKLTRGECAIFLMLIIVIFILFYVFYAIRLFLKEKKSEKEYEEYLKIYNRLQNYRNKK